MKHEKRTRVQLEGAERYRRMKRYIDAYKIPYHDLSDGKGLCQVAFLEDVMKVPTADVVEVVRCKDCVYRPCEMMSHSYDFDFCSYGERAEE